jgi:phosphoserine phosphatase
MLKGRWTPENRAGLEQLLTRQYKTPPIAIFDWDNTCVQGDTADLVFHSLCRDLAFKFEAGGFVDWVNEIPIPHSILECVEAYRSHPAPQNRAALRFELERTRQALHNGEDDNQAWGWDSGAFVGWTTFEVRDYTRRVIARELAQPLRSERLEGRGDVTSPVEIEIPRGLRLRSEMRELLYELRRAGWLLYVITASPQWEIEAFVERYNLPPQYVVGMRREIVNGRITASPATPVSWGDGKLDAYQMYVTRERPPNLVAGDSVGDWKLLEWATDTALIVEPTHSGLRDYAVWKKTLGEAWFIQSFE